MKYHVFNLNCRERYEDVINHCSYTHSLSSLNGIQTHDLCQSSQLSAQPKIVTVQTKRSEVCAKITQFQYFPIQFELARSVSGLLYAVKYLILLSFKKQ